MNDQTAQDPQQPQNSYVDDYTPPVNDSNATPAATQDSAQMPPVMGADATQDNRMKNDEPLDDDDFEGTHDASVSDEDIEAQNIFFMLGVDDGDEELKEKFLDQLQEVIWDDFLTNDVSLLLSQDEMVEFNTYKQRVDSTQAAEQESAKDEMVEYLEKLIPDLEEIMLEKALDLKADLFTERINGMKEYFAQNSEKLEKLNQAEQLMFEDKWKSAATILNEIQE